MASRELKRFSNITQIEDDGDNESEADLNSDGENIDDGEESEESSPANRNNDDNEFLRSIDSPARGRALMDTIRKEQKLAGSGSVRSEMEGPASWKVVPTSPSSSPLFARSASRTAAEPEPDSGLPFLTRPDNSSAGSGMSLMALLGGSGRFEDSDDEEEEEGGGGDVAKAEALDHTCCICMVKHKGSPFVPCGHTLCRLCSTELCETQGNCPLCNGFIMEILDIF